MHSQSVAIFDNPSVSTTTLRRRPRQPSTVTGYYLLLSSVAHRPHWLPSIVVSNSFPLSLVDACPLPSLAALCCHWPLSTIVSNNPLSSLATYGRNNKYKLLFFFFFPEKKNGFFRYCFYMMLQRTWLKFDSILVKKFGHSCIVTKRININRHAISTSCIPNSIYS